MILIIAEKPSVAGEIAKVVGATTRGKGYLSGNDYIVSWCVGHLIELAKPGAYGEGLEKWSLDTLPIIPENYITEVSSATADQYAVLKELMSRADVSELVEATDAGREGELIFRLVYNQAGCKKPFKRLWISSMEEKSIKDGLAGMKPGSAYDNLYEAALCRQRADWLVGINLTRLFSKMYNKTLTCGRVQTPTINLIVNRQRSIENFVPQTYFTLTANCGSFKAYSRADDQAKAQQIVEKCTRHSDESYQQIAVCSLKNILRRLHRPENKGTQQAGKQCDDDRHDSGYFQTDRNITPHRHIVARTKFLSYGNSKSSTASVAEA